MAAAGFSSTPRFDTYDLIIIGGAMMGSSAAFWLTKLGFDGRILVIERDPTFEFSSTSHTNSCIRQQFSNKINIQISQFGVEFIKSFRDQIGDTEAPEQIFMRSFGYLYLADNPTFAQTLRDNQAIQAAEGAGTRLMTADEIEAEWPYMQAKDIVLGSHNPVNEGYFDGGTIFDWVRKRARAGGVEYLAGEVASIQMDASRVTGVTLTDGTSIACGKLLNASGPRAAATAAMATINVPIEPRKRYTFIFSAEEDLEKDLPLTIDPSGVHMRWDGKNYLAGCPPDDDPSVDYDDFIEDHSLWENKVWPILATRVPQFERIRLENSWVGHYAFNTLDQNAVLGPHPEIENFHFLNGFSGHGLQQSPAMGRAAAELLTFGEFRTLDLTPFGFERIASATPFLETAVI